MPAPARTEPLTPEVVKPEPKAEAPKPEPVRTAPQKTVAAAAKADVQKAAPAKVEPPKSEPKAEPAKPEVVAEVKPDAPKPEPGPAPVKAPNDHTVKLRFRGESWVEIKDRNGRVLLSRINAPGSETEVSGRPPFAIVIGNAPDVQLTYDDRDFALEPHTRVAVARFTLE